MKKTITIFVTLSLVFALCACGKTVTPAVTPGQPSAEPVKTTELTNRLNEIRTDYHEGVAGSSLEAVKIAGKLLDYAAAAAPTAKDVSAETAAFCKTLEGDDVLQFSSKIQDIYSSAMQTCGTNGPELLSSAGYKPQSTWTAESARNLFDAIFTGASITPPVYVAIYSSDDQAERFVTNYVKVDKLSPEVLVEQLSGASVLGDGVKVLSFEAGDGKTISLDLSADFQKQVASTGTAGEYMIMGSVVNTFLAAYGADEIKLSSDGKTIQTGHEIYESPLKLYPDNTAK